MDQQEIRSVLRKKDGGKIDSYLQKNPKKKTETIDLFNLIQTWTHSLLYHARLYPSQAFTEKLFLGQKVHVASASALTNYLDSFFRQLQPHLPHLNHLTILLIDPQGSPIESHTLHMHDYSQTHLEPSIEETAQTPNHIQKEIEMKSFLLDLQSSFKHLKKVEEGSSFRLRVGYRMQTGIEPSHSSLVDHWAKRQRLGGELGSTQIKASLKSHSLNVIYEVERC